MAGIRRDVRKKRINDMLKKLEKTAYDIQKMTMEFRCAEVFLEGSEKERLDDWAKINYRKISEAKLMIEIVEQQVILMDMSLDDAIESVTNAIAKGYYVAMNED